MADPAPDNLGEQYQQHRILVAQRSAGEALLMRARKPAAAPAPKGAATVPATAPQTPVEGGEGGALEMAGRVVKDVGEGIVETPRAILKGVRDAYQSVIDMGDELGSWLERTSGVGGVILDSDGVRFASGEEMAEVPRLADEMTLPDLNAPDSVTGSMVKGVAQFLTGMKGAGKALKLAGVPQMSGAAGYGVSALKGAIANFTAFDPHQQRLSNLIEQFPALSNPVTAYLASSPDDNAAEGRFKNALEGLGLGLATDGFLKGVKLLRNVAAAKAAASVDEAAVVTAGAAPQVADDAFRTIGDETLAPDAPFIQTRPRAAPAANDAAIGGNALDVDPAKLGKGAAPEPETFINFARIDSTDDVKRVMQELADAAQPGLDEARRGVQTFEKITLNAQQQNAWNALKARRAGQPMNAEASVAARQLWASSSQKVTELAEAAAQNPSEANLFAFRKMLTVHDAIQREVIAARTETARALASWRIPVGPSSERLKDIAGRLQETGGPEVARELAARVAALGKAGMYNEMAAVVEKGAWATSRDAVVEAWINGLLSNPATHVANTVSNSSVLGLRMVERRLGASIASVLGDEGSVAAGEAAMQWHGLTKGLRDAFRFAAKAARTGETGYGLGKMEIPREGAISSEAFRLSSGSNLGRAVDLLGGLVRVPGRALAAEDEFFKTVGYRMELHAQALRQATREVAAGSIDEAGLGKRVAELVANPPSTVRTAAIDAAAYQTFTNAPGEIAQKLSSMTSKFPALKLFLPFVRTPANILKFTFERTPLAPLMKDFRANVAAGGARRDTALAQMALGSSVMFAMADLAMDGEVTGRGPVDAGQRAALQRTGWQPYSIRVGDRWVTYNRLDPLGSLIGMSSDVVEALRNAQAESLDDADTEALTVATAIAIGGNLVNKTYLSGISDLFEALSDPTRYGEGMVQRLAGSVIPAGAAAVNRQMDPYQREVYSMLDAIKSRTPGLSDELTPRRNLWGEALKWESGFGKAFDMMSPVYTKPGDAEPIDRVMLEQGWNITMPPRKTSIDGVQVDLGQHPKAYSRYLELSGNALKHPAWGLGAKDLLNAIVEGRHPLSQIYRMKSDGPDGGKDIYVRSLLNDYREMARRQLQKEFPELAGEVDQKKARQRAINYPRIG